MRIPRPHIVVLSCLLCLGPGGLAAQTVRNDSVAIVPAGRAVAVDGSLADWDLTASIDSELEPALAPLFSARLSLMYDRDALYVAARVADDTPLRNAFDPTARRAGGGDRGDALHLRLHAPTGAGKPARTVRITMWAFGPDATPAMALEVDDQPGGQKVLTGADAQLAFRSHKDGYTLEARLSWARLGLPSGPRPGQKLRLGVRYVWGDSQGLRRVCLLDDLVRGPGLADPDDPAGWGEADFLAKGQLAPSQRPAGQAGAANPLELDLPLADPRASSLSAALYDSQGQLVRTLPVTALSPPPPGPAPAPAPASAPASVRIRWDGLDDDQRPLPPGRYVLRTLSHRGVGQRYVASLHNAGNPPWRTDDGTGSWGGDHGPPIAAASDADRVYLGWVISEAGWAVIACNKTLQAGRPRKLWGQHQVLEIGMHVTAMASDGQRLFVAQDGARWGQKEGDTYSAGVVLWEAATGKPVSFPFGQRALVLSQWKDSLKPEDLLAPERLSVYHPPVPKKRFHQRLADHDFGPQETGWNLMGLAVAGEVLYGSLFLENRIVAVNWRTGKLLREFALPRPAGLALDKDGSLLAVAGGKVVRIDPAGGAVRDVVAGGLAHPWGLALDARGKIYVSDCGQAMQVKVFEGDGKPAGTIGAWGGRPWAGRYDPAGVLRPAHMTVDAEGKLWLAEHDDSPRRFSVWQADSGKRLAELLGPGAYAVEGLADPARPAWINVHHALFELDYATGLSRPLATLIRPEMAGRQLWPDGGHMGRALHFRTVKGRRYLVHGGRGVVVIYRLGDDLAAHPVAAVGPASALPLHGLTRSDIPADIRDDYWRNSHAYAFGWTDLDGDRLMQAGELRMEKVSPFWGLYWGSWVDDELTIWSGSRGQVWRVPVEAWQGQAPLYPAPSRQKPLFAPLGDEVHHVMPLGGGVCVLEQKGGDARGSASKWSAVSMYDAQGKRRWAYRRATLGFGLDSPLARPGEVVGAMKFIGSSHLEAGADLADAAARPAILGVNGYFGQFNLLTEHGLYLASLCKDNRYGPRADATTVWPENFSGQLFRNGEDGKTYLLAGDTDARVWEVTGLESVRIASAEVAIERADQERALAAAARRQGPAWSAGPIRLARAPSARTIDGELKEWDAAGAVRIDAGAGRSARAMLAYDDQRLYAAFEVDDDSPLRNAGKDPALMFKTGDACEVLLATDPAADPRRTRPARGDLRVLLGELEGKGVAVVHEPLSAHKNKQPRTFSSPTGAETFERAGPIEGAAVAVRRTPAGYVLEAALPLSALGLSPQPGASLRGDLGVIFSDAGGSRNVLRACHADKQTAIVNDIPSEVRLHPNRWTMMVVEGKP